MDIALKQRLVGASVLIALAVVVLPMLLGGRPEGGPSGTARIEIDENPEAVQFQTRRFPIGEEPAPAVREESEPAPLELPTPGPVTVETPETGSEARTGPADDPVLPVSEPEPELELVTSPGPAESTPGEGAPVAAEPERAETPPPTREPAPAQSRTDGRYVVQVASFGSANNAAKLSASLRDLGYGVLTDTVTSDVGTLNRVRVGPYASEAEAGRVVAQLREQIEGSKPRVMDLQPERSERVTEPSDPLVRWVVQVGSFSNAANAENLVAKLRLEGQTAYSEQVSGSGSTIYRVRVGPFIERDEAIRVDRLIQERLALDGVVMSAD